MATMLSLSSTPAPRTNLKNIPTRHGRWASKRVVFVFLLPFSLVYLPVLLHGVMRLPPLDLSGIQLQNSKVALTHPIQSTTEHVSKQIISDISKSKSTLILSKLHSNRSAVAAVAATLPSHSNVRFFNGTAGCSISAVKYLDCGYHGHAYSADLNCPNQPKAQQRVVVKVVTLPVNVSDDHKGPWLGKYNTSPRKYVSADSDEKQVLHRTMLQNVPQHIQRYFAIVLGTVSIPRATLVGQLKFANKKCGFAHAGQTVTEVSGETITGQIFPYATGSRLDHFLGTPEATPAARRRIVADLVRMFRHMNDRQVLHCDVSYYHILYSIPDKQTSLIDFESFEILDNDAKAQQRQLWQLLAMIGNVCNYSGKGVSPFSVPNDVCQTRRRGTEVNSTNLMQRLIPAFNDCGFARPMAWNNWTMSNTKRTYEELVEWSKG